MSGFPDSSFDPSHPALMFEAAKNLSQSEFHIFAETIGLSTESCKCHACINDNPRDCYTETEAPLWCCIHVIQPRSEQLTRPEDFQVGMHLYVGIPGQRQYMAIVRELTPEMVVLDIASIISLKNGYLNFEPFNGHWIEGTAIQCFFGISNPQIFRIPAFLIKR